MGAGRIVLRHKVLAFYGVPSADGEVTFHRMSKFTSLSQSKNPIEHSRQYTDEKFSQTDVIGYAPSIDYSFDRHSGNAVLTDMIEIGDKELVGDDAVRSIIWVDTETGKAVKRDYSVIPNAEGDNINIYTHSGTLKCRGDSVYGTATSSDEWQTVTFNEETN